MTAALLFFIGVGLGGICGALWILYRQQQEERRQKAASEGKSPDLVKISQRSIGYPLLIEIEGRRYWSVSEIVEPDHRALLFAAARTLLAQIPPDQLDTLTAHLAPQEETSDTSLVEPEPKGAQIQTPSPEPTAPLAPARGATSAAPTGMIREIDAIFQAILQTTPGAPEASLLSAADGTMLIKVGSRYYRSVDEIAHPQVRQALRQAIKQWEARI
ncbi:MAG: hypothetical protein Q9O62_14375 [Ardenticatenia bacterium]|nr:hypothetical protein [Ardenticatenia bacterium]